jgi:hypothetical protein
MANARSIIARGATALSLSLLVGCTSSAAEPEVASVHALYPSYSTSTELIKSSDLVVRGTAMSSRVEQMFPEESSSDDPVANPQAGLSEAEVAEWRKKSAVVVTVSSVRVDEVIKGAADVGDTIEVSQLGGEFEGTRYQETETTMLSADSTNYVLFLAAHGSGKPFDLLNPEQAMYTVSGDGLLTQAGEGAKPLDITNLRGLKSAVAQAK